MDLQHEPGNLIDEPTMPSAVEVRLEHEQFLELFGKIAFSKSPQRKLQELLKLNETHDRLYRGIYDESHVFQASIVKALQDLSDFQLGVLERKISGL